MNSMIFIDGGNVFHSVKSYNKKHNKSVKIDFERFSNFLKGITNSSSVFRSYYYTGVPMQVSNHQMAFLTKLELLPNFEVKKKILKIKNGKFIEKGVDVHIVTDMLWNGIKHHCDQIILVSGDEDLTEAVVKLKENGIRVTVAAFESNVSSLIRRTADKFINLEKHVDSIAFI